ncbi:MAG TPA: hypothetical protein VLL54_14300 [Pyrinomonadaceae bacterium]|nr:hypothetical protein [Pyrinomonadaceae bacterium]
MNFYKELNLTPIRSDPDVWIKRLVIFSKITPAPEIVRDIALSRGLNIVWAEEVDEDDPNAEIGGHSAGKTTFCRLLRYVLGEKTFGTKTNADLIRRSFAEGYVAAELQVAGQNWAVRRPIGNGRLSYVKQNITIEELLADHGESVSQDEYPRKIGLDGLLDNLETGAVVRTGEPIQWDHILAWASRDQEARFQNIHYWRSPRSESETPAFRFPKEGALFVMRTAIGLFYPDELRGEENLAKLQREKDQLEKDIEEKRREPQFRVNLYNQELRRKLKSILVNEPNIDTIPLTSGDLLPDLKQLSHRAIDEIKKASEGRRQERDALQTQIDEVGAEVRHFESELQRLDIIFQLGAASSREFDTARSARSNELKETQKHEDALCPFGNVLIRDCSYVIDRQRVLQISESQDLHVMRDAENKRKAEIEKIEDEKSKFRNVITKLHNDRAALQAKRESVGREIRSHEDAAADLIKTCESLELWTTKAQQESEYPELVRSKTRLEEVVTEIQKLETRLMALLQKHDQNRQLLASIFSRAVQAVLSEHYDGQVLLDNRELAFRITHGPAMSGEAIETLCVLLSDFGSLIYNTVSEASHLPGFMLHDSPREADLGLRIYRSFIRFVASVTEQLGGNDGCPFQYILTTTTPPPEELRNAPAMKLKLNASKFGELLLRKNIAEAPESGPTLFGPATS